MAELLFLSYRAVDLEAARVIKARIENAPAARERGLQVFLFEDDNVGGERWIESIQEYMTRSTAYAVYITTDGMLTRWVWTEIQLAIGRFHQDPDYPLIPILGPGGTVDGLPALLRLHQAVEHVERNEEALQVLIRGILRIGGREPLVLEEHPFLGLQYFTAKQAHLFFGRDRETQDLVDLLHKEHLVMIVGDSGSGKSSLVKAGLVPRFRMGAFSERTDETAWHVVETRPLNHPFRQLADACVDAAREAGIADDDHWAIRKQIESGDPARVRAGVVHSAPVGARILLVIDQFEELLTLTRFDDRGSFVDTLMMLADPLDDRIRVVLTMRRDYFNLLSVEPYAALYFRLKANHRRARYLLHRMSADGLRECIERPLRLAGRTKTEIDLLAADVLRDVGDQPGELALLEMALTKAWDTRHKHMDNLLLAYDANGRVEGSLANAANLVFTEKLNAEEQELAEALFIRLVKLGDTGGTIRRVAYRDEFRDTVWALAQRLAGPDHDRLLTIRGQTDADEAREEETALAVELTHEALAFQWEKYQAWLQGNRKDPRAADKRTLDRLIDTTARWVEFGRDDSLLVRGAQLDIFSQLRRNRPNWVSDTEAVFIAASQAAEIRGRRWFMGGLAGFVAVVLAFSGFVFYQFLQLATTEIGVRKEQARILASKADKQSDDGFHDRAVLISLAALPPPSGDQRLVTREARVQLERALYSNRLDLVLGDLDGEVNSVAFSAGGTRILTGGADGTARLWDAGTGKQIRVFQGHVSAVTSVAVTGDDTRVLTGSVDGTARLWDISTGQPIRTFTGHKNTVNDALLSVDGTIVLTGSRDGTARLWNASTGAVIRILTGHDGPVRSVALSADGARALTGGADETARLWNTATGEQERVFRSPVADHRGGLLSVDIPPDGSRVLTGSNDGAVRLWDRNTGEQIRAFTGHDRAVRSVTLSADGQRVLTAGDDRTTRLWDVRTGTEIHAFVGHVGRVWSAALSSDGTRVLTGSSDSTARLWNANFKEESRTFTGHGGDVRSVALSPDGTKALTGDNNGTLRLWDIATGRLIRSFGDVAGEVWSARFSKTGARLLTGHADGKTRLWDAGTGTMLLTLTGHEGDVRSVAFFEDETHLLTASNDGSARLWDAETGEVVRTLVGCNRRCKTPPSGRLLWAA